MVTVLVNCKNIHLEHLGDLLLHRPYRLMREIITELKGTRLCLVHNNRWCFCVAWLFLDTDNIARSYSGQKQPVDYGSDHSCGYLEKTYDKENTTFRTMLRWRPASQAQVRREERCLAVPLPNYSINTSIHSTIAHPLHHPPHPKKTLRSFYGAKNVHPMLRTREQAVSPCRKACCMPIHAETVHVLSPSRCTNATRPKPTIHITP